IDLRSSYAEAHYNLGRLLVQKGLLDEAIAHYEKALEMNPADAEAHNNLGATLFANGHVDEAIAHYRKALAIKPDYADVSSNLAWLLATAADPSLRNGSEAVFLAERAESDSSRSQNHAIILRILAAAYAETGRFPEAKGTAEQALQAAEVQGNSALSNALRDELTLYELGLPYHK